MKRKMSALTIKSITAALVSLLIAGFGFLIVTMLIINGTLLEKYGEYFVYAAEIIALFIGSKIFCEGNIKKSLILSAAVLSFKTVLVIIGGKGQGISGANIAANILILASIFLGGVKLKDNKKKKLTKKYNKNR